MTSFKINVNRYGGVFIDPNSLPDKAHTFRKWLEDSLPIWKEAGYVSVWVEIPEQKAYLIQTAVDLGFSFHHAYGHALTLNHRLANEFLSREDISIFNKGVVETAVSHSGFVSRWFVPPTDPTFAQKYELFLPSI